MAEIVLKGDMMKLNYREEVNSGYYSDHKIVFIDDSANIKEWNEIVQSEREIILKYFGYKSPIEKIGN